MAQVPDRVLSWLWSVLQPYSNSQVVYNDVIGTLTTFPSLQPSTAVYTYETGQPALLLRLSGTLPVDFRGAQYRFPLEIWVPQEFGERGVGVIAYVRPELDKGQGSNITIRPGQHVSVDGRIYHPYLRDWALQGRASLVEFLRICQSIFAKEPPVVSKSQAPRQAETRSPRPTSGVPAPPPKERDGSLRQPVEMAGSPGPPPLPAKPGQDTRPSRTPGQSQRSIQRDGPPLPPLPYQHAHSQDYSRVPSQSNGTSLPVRNSSMTHASRPSRDYAGPPPLPPLPTAVQQRSSQPNGERSPVSPLTPEHRAELSNDRYHRPPPLPADQSQSPTSMPRRYQQTPQYQPDLPPRSQVQSQQQHPGTGQVQPRLQGHDQQSSYTSQSQYRYDQVSIPTQQQRTRPPSQQYPSSQIHQPRQPYPPQYQQTQQPTPKAAPPPDLLTDPFDISLPTTSPNAGPPPPIPPNPEKEHLLTLLSQSLTSQLTSQISQNTSALSPLQAQNHALQQAHAQLSSELHQLQSLDAALSSNEAILHQSLRDCDAVIESSSKQAPPEIDDVLVAPTVAANQLWNLCADEVAIREAIWCLQRAVGAGRVGGTEFVRLTRGLAREGFLKMVLARKVAVGLGLDVRGLEVLGGR